MSAGLSQKMAYARGSETPWHNFANQVASNAPIETWAYEGAMDYTVLRRRMYFKETRDGNAVLPVGNFESAEDEVKGIGAMMAFVRAPYRDDKKWRTYGIFSDKSIPTQPISLLQWFKDAAESMDITIETVGTLKHGAVCWALARINHGADFKLRGEDWVKGYVLITTSHDGSLKFQAFTTAVRVVCMNTFRAAFADKERKDVLFAMKHNNTNREEILKAAHGKLEQAIDNMRIVKEQSELLASVPMNQDQVREYVYQLVTGKSLLKSVVETQTAVTTGSTLDAIVAQQELQQEINQVQAYSPEDLKILEQKVGRSILGAIYNSPGAGMGGEITAWDAYNGATYHADYLSGNKENRGLSNPNRFYSATFGPGAEQKQTALELALNYAKTA